MSKIIDVLLGTPSPTGGWVTLKNIISSGWYH
jgi:hypothetical protein